MIKTDKPDGGYVQPANKWHGCELELSCFGGTANNCRKAQSTCNACKQSIKG